jgi:DNA-binding NarL/FixJ family response regulator
VSKRARVLVVDDQALNRQGIMALLELAADIQVTHEACNGQQAVQFVAEEQPDVVLMDVRMPIMDGLEATRQIKDRWPQVKVIVLTMYPAHEAEATAAGADRFLLKGVATGSLPEVIRSLAVPPPKSEGAVN